MSATLFAMVKDARLRFVLNPVDEDESWAVVPMPDGVATEDLRWTGDALIVDLGPLTAQLLERIDAECGAFRQRFITTVPGQEMTYLEKETQARAFVAGAPIEACPFIGQEAGARGISAAAMAAMVIAQADAWRALGAKIETLRMGAKLAVQMATTREAKLAGAAVNWAGALVP